MSSAALDSGAKRRKRRGYDNGRTDAVVWLWLMAPASLLLAVVFILPMGGIVLLSLHPSTGRAQVGSAFTLHNFVEFFSDPFYLRVLGNSLELALAATVATLALAYPSAYFLARTRSRYAGALNFLVFAPLLVSILIRNLGWLPVLAENGIVNRFLLWCGLVHAPLELENNFIGVAIGLVHALLPYMVITLAGVIRNIAPEIEEASINLGAGPLRTFFNVVLPLSRPGALAGSLLVFTLAIGAFTTPVIMGGNRVLVMPTYITGQMQTLLNYPRGATAAVVLLVLTLGLTGLSVRLATRRQGQP